MIKKYWPSVTDVNESSKTQSANPPKFNIDKSKIEDAEFTELDDEK